MAGVKLVRMRTTAGTIVRVSEEEAARFARGFALIGKESVRRDEPLSASWKLDELKAYAKEHEIDLGDATKKADVLAAIELELEERAGAAD